MFGTGIVSVLITIAIVTNFVKLVRQVHKVLRLIAASELSNISV